MGNGQPRAAQEATETYERLGARLFELGEPALKGGADYLSSAYKMGGTLDQSRKFDAMRTSAIEQGSGRTGSFLDPNFGTRQAGQAQAVAGVGSQQITAALDEINKIRSALSGQGLKTTSFAEQAAGQSVQALGFMYPGSQTQDYVKAGLGLGSAFYGGFTQPARPGTSSTPASGPSFTGGGGY